jgi:hypothetical protein
MWRMDSLSVGISILRSGGQRTKLPGLRTVSDARLLAVPPDHGRLEIAITIVWKR